MRESLACAGVEWSGGGSGQERRSGFDAREARIGSVRWSDL